MADAAVGILLNKVVSLVDGEASLLGRLRQDFHEIKRELVVMKAFLKDADKKSFHSDVVKTWVDHVRDLAYDVEDIVDEFMYHLESQPRGSGFKSLALKVLGLIKNVRMRHYVASKLRDVCNEIKAACERSKLYGFNHLEEGTSSYDALRNRGESSLFIESDAIVGIENEKDLLFGWLMDGELQRTVISVHGMGGSGKTTLVAQVYKNKIIRKDFDCHAWITVSQSYVIEDLFRNMIKEFFDARKELVPGALGNMNYKDLLETLVNYLQDKRYIIILDDVWSSNLWMETGVSLPNNGLRSRIMVTTRREDIASFSFGTGGHVLKLKPLGKAESWELFCKKAFPGDPKRCPRHLESLAQHLVQKCEGLPLAIVAMGGLMSSKSKMESQWRNVRDRLNWELHTNSMLEPVKCVLMLSYDDLPIHLKHCFLYCCAFPEDYLIRRRRLVRLWVAEGFVEEGRGMTLEDVADSYFQELICRSMLQMDDRKQIGISKYCRVHDLMREIGLSISEREKFFAIYDGKESKENGGKFHRLSMHLNDRKIQSGMNLSRLRSLLVFFTGASSQFHFDMLPSGFKLLRVLDLQRVPIDRVPDELCSLFNLRYLNLRKTQVKELPRSLGKLGNLQTLDIRDSRVRALPEGITKLKNLRHLMVYSGSSGLRNTCNYISGVQISKDVWKLSNLQVLTCIEAKGDLVRKIGSMKQMRKLGISNVRGVDEMELCISIQKMDLLHFLLVAAKDEEEVLCFNALREPPPHLETLNLIGKMDKVPLWFCALQNLISMDLHWSRLAEDLLPHIEELPNLAELFLSNTYDGEQMSFNSGFLKLRTLYLANFPHLSNIIIAKGVMPNIQKLFLHNCRQLKMLPQGTEHLTSLQTLALQNGSDELIERIRGEASVDHP